MPDDQDYNRALDAFWSALTLPTKPGQAPGTSRGPDMSTCHRSSGQSWASPSRRRRNRTGRCRRTWTRPAPTSRCRGACTPPSTAPRSGPGSTRRTPPSPRPRQPSLPAWTLTSPPGTAKPSHDRARQKIRPDPSITGQVQPPRRRVLGAASRGNGESCQSGLRPVLAVTRWLRRSTRLDLPIRGTCSQAPRRRALRRACRCPGRRTRRRSGGERVGSPVFTDAMRRPGPMMTGGPPGPAVRGQNPRARGTRSSICILRARPACRRAPGR